MRAASGESTAIPLTVHASEHNAEPSALTSPRSPFSQQVHKTADLPLWFLSPVRFLEFIRLQVQGKWRAAFSLLLPHRPLQPWSSIGVSGTSPSLQSGPTLWPVNEINEGRNSFLPRKTLELMFRYNSLCRSDDRKKCHQCQGEQCHTQTHLAREDHRAGGFIGGGSESERVGDYFPSRGQCCQHSRGSETQLPSPVVLG